MDSLKNVLKTKRLPADLCGVKFAKNLRCYRFGKKIKFLILQFLKERMKNSFLFGLPFSRIFMGWQQTVI